MEAKHYKLELRRFNDTYETLANDYKLELRRFNDKYDTLADKVLPAVASLTGGIDRVALYLQPAPAGKSLIDALQEIEDDEDVIDEDSCEDLKTIVTMALDQEFAAWVKLLGHQNVAYNGMLREAASATAKIDNFEREEGLGPPRARLLLLMTMFRVACSGAVHARLADVIPFVYTHHARYHEENNVSGCDAVFAAFFAQLFADVTAMLVSRGQ